MITHILHMRWHGCISATGENWRQCAQSLLCPSLDPCQTNNPIRQRHPSPVSQKKQSFVRDLVVAILAKQWNSRYLLGAQSLYRLSRLTNNRLLPVEPLFNRQRRWSSRRQALQTPWMRAPKGQTTASVPPGRLLWELQKLTWPRLCKAYLRRILRCV